jgi:hypothetical protein
VPVTRASVPSTFPVAAAAAPEAPAVRVHIGRLEVRANLQAAPPAPPAARPPRHDGVALSAYLRGKRDAT